MGISWTQCMKLRQYSSLMGMSSLMHEIETVLHADLLYATPDSSGARSCAIFQNSLAMDELNSCSNHLNAYAQPMCCRLHNGSELQMLC